jgi:hypothetical protein
MIIYLEEIDFYMQNMIFKNGFCGNMVAKLTLKTTFSNSCIIF